MDAVTEQRDSARATVNMVHNNVALTISEAEASRVEDEAKRRLLASKKLSLVVDLDQTIIHATVDPTVGDWQKDQSNPNYEAVKDVRSFLLKDDGPGNRGCWYYVKLRPGLQDFLLNISKIYELHIYTMGTRQYAKHIAEIIDPGEKIFGDRILSRDESGSMIAKNLQRLFPVDTKMVVIIDDRADVWKWSPNLIKVTPYEFFVGIGDINSSFLPKKPEIKLPPQAEKPTEDDAAASDEISTPVNGVDSHEEKTEEASRMKDLVDVNASPIDQLVAMGGTDDPASRSAQSTQQDEAIAAQLEERPLLQKQKKLEAEEATNSSASALKDETEDNKSESEKSNESNRPKQNLLHDHDRELYQLENSLRMVHKAFYDSYDQSIAGAQGGRLGQLRGAKKPKLSSESSDLDLVPDVKNIMPTVKSKVLGNTSIVFSGMVPLGVDVMITDLAIQSTSFGARIEEDISKYTTHLVAARNRTQKVRNALRRRKGKIKIVSPHWLYDSINSWTKKDETPFLLDVEEPRNGTFDEDEEVWSESESLAGEGSDTESTDSLAAPARKPARLKLTTKPPPSDVGDNESAADGDSLVDFEYDEKSPVGGTNEDWDAMNDELKDFLGSEAEESEDDNTSVSSQKSNASSSVALRGRKRTRDTYESGGESGSENPASKKQVGATSLSQNTVINEHEGEQDGSNKEAATLAPPAEEGDGWSDFADEDFEAELEKALSEGQDEPSSA